VALLFIAHGFYGAFLPGPALWLGFGGAGLLTIALCRSGSRADLGGLTGLVWVGLLFILVLVTGLWSLTAAMPGGAHPIWGWASLPNGAATIDRSATMIELIKLMGLACFFLLGCLMGARADRMRPALAAILIVGGLWAFMALIRFLTFSGPRSGSRLDGGFYTANSAATVLGLLLVLAVVWSVRQWRRSDRLRPPERLSSLAPGAAAALLFGACLLLTASRAGIASTAAALALVGLWDGLQAGRFRPLRSAATLILALMGGAYYAVSRTTLTERFGQVSEDAEVRRTLLDVHWQAFLNSPLTGHGLGSYTWVNNQMTTPQTFPEMSATIVLHNAPVQILEEGGLFGAAPLFLLIATILALTAWHTVRRRSNRLALIGLIAVSVVVIGHSLVDVSLQTPSIAGLWALLLGLGFAASQASANR
jgi:O-antigen ligase